MKDSTYYEKNYRTICSCCGDNVSVLDRELPNNDDLEGNLCGTCYSQHQLDAWFEMANIFVMIEDALSPINSIKFRYCRDKTKWRYATKLIRLGVIKWKIN